MNLLFRNVRFRFLCSLHKSYSNFATAAGTRVHTGQKQTSFFFLPSVLQQTVSRVTESKCKSSQSAAASVYCLDLAGSSIQRKLVVCRYSNQNRTYSAPLIAQLLESISNEMQNRNISKCYDFVLQYLETKSNCLSPQLSPFTPGQTCSRCNCIVQLRKP